MLSKKAIDVHAAADAFEKHTSEIIAELKQNWNIAETEDLVFIGKFEINKLNTQSGFLNQVSLQDEKVIYRMATLFVLFSVLISAT